MSRWHGPNSWTPFREIQREVDRLFAPGTWRVPRGVPPVNLYEVDQHYLLTTPLPGLGPDNVELSITGETLTIRGERRRPENDPEERYRRQDRVLGRWTRTITLPDRVEIADVTATFAHGLLAVTVPKAKQESPRQIHVTSPAAEPAAPTA